jgi:hypothetical protein
MFNQNTLSTKFVQEIMGYLSKTKLILYNNPTLRYGRNKINANFCTTRYIEDFIHVYVETRSIKYYEIF